MESQNGKLEWLLETGLNKAVLWEPVADGKVRCQLCPRTCVIKPDSFGFCKTRYNKGGELKTAIWGKLLTPSIEPIETEAVFHYWPGEKILSVGNLGCNLDCDFCQNWESSNMNNLKPEFVKYNTPQEIVDLAKKLNIQVISFTYNDPVIWFEFVYETARIAREHGLKTLFKSAGFISAEAAQKLTEVIDIFSISLKSSNPDTFKKMSKGILSHVLEAIKIFYKSGSHLELSNLVVTGLTDVEDEIRQLAKWVKNELDENVPVHFVRFHPAYKYLHVPRTPIGFLEKAKEVALKEGLKYVYIGNTYQENHADIHCKECGNLLVKRFGLYSGIKGLHKNGTCNSCGKRQQIILCPEKNVVETDRNFNPNKNSNWQWSDIDAPNLHLQILNQNKTDGCLVCEHLSKNGDILSREYLNVPPVSEVRMAIGQGVEEEKEVRISFSDEIICEVAHLEDRAHFPLEQVHNLIRN